MNWLIGLIGVGAAILLVLVLWSLFQRAGRLSSPVNTGKPSKAGFSVWSFQGASWSLHEDRSAPGHVPGRPPAEAGLFEGYCIRVTSVRSPEAR